MIIKRLDDILDTDRHVTGDGWESRRLVLADEGLGYSLHDTVVEEGSELTLSTRTTSRPTTASRASARSSMSPPVKSTRSRLGRSTRWTSTTPTSCGP